MESAADRIVRRLVLNSLFFLVLAGWPVVVYCQTNSGEKAAAIESSPGEVDHHDAPEFVEPSKTLLTVEVGRSRLLHFPDGVRRVAMSNTDSSDAVQVTPKDVLVLGKKLGAANFFVWPANRARKPLVMVVRVE